MINTILIFVILILALLLVLENEQLQFGKARRHKIAGNLGLHNIPNIAELALSSASKDELISLIECCDNATFTKIARSNHFYLVESRNSTLSLYCSIDEPCEEVTYKDLQTDHFLRVRVQDFLLERFLRELAKRNEEVKKGR